MGRYVLDAKARLSQGLPRENVGAV